MNYWIESADGDYKTMKNLYNSEDYSWCLFIGHLVIEKLIKGIYAKNNPNSPHAKKIHDLLILANNCGLQLNDDKKDKLDLITTFNINARYDDYKKDFYNKCTKEYTSEQVKNIEEIRAWLKEQLI
jgi:HEPN domain-containing protein